MSYADSTWFQSPSSGSTVTTAGPVQNPGYTSGALGWGNLQQTILQSGTHAVINAGISTAINGGSLGQNLGGALVGEGIDLGAALGNKSIGDIADALHISPGTAGTIFMHALLGGIISLAQGGDFASGAIAGGAADGLTPVANQFMAEYVSEKFRAGDLTLDGSQYKITTAQIIGLASAALAGGNPAVGSMIGGSGEKYNQQGHPKNPVEEVDQEVRHELGESIPRQEAEDLDIITTPILQPPPMAGGLGGLFGGAKATGGAVDRATTGIEWGKGIQGQGMPWEDYLGTQLPAGSRLPPNFKTFDFFDRTTGVATSAKTLDTTTAAKIANPGQVYSSLKGNIDTAAGFTEYGLKDVTVSSSQITSRELQVAVPKSTTSAQWDQINRAIEYGQGKGVTVKITKVD